MNYTDEMVRPFISDPGRRIWIYEVPHSGWLVWHRVWMNIGTMFFQACVGYDTNMWEKK